MRALHPDSARCSGGAFRASFQPVRFFCIDPGCGQGASRMPGRGAGRLGAYTLNGEKGGHEKERKALG